VESEQAGKSAPTLGSLCPDAEVCEDLTDLAFSLGYAWPDDVAGRWRVLKIMASRASRWRAECAERSAAAWSEAEKGRLYQHLLSRNRALAAKVTNLRSAMRDYMAGQRIAIAEARADLERKRKDAAK